MTPTGHLLGGMFESQRKDRTGVPFSEREDAFIRSLRTVNGYACTVLRRSATEISERRWLLDLELMNLTARLTG